MYKAGKAENSLIHSNRYFNNTEREFSEKFHRVLIREIHTHSKDSSYRRLLVNLDQLNRLIEEAKERLGPFVISMKLFVPSVDAGIYYAPENLNNVVIYHSEKTERKDIPNLFFDNTTTLIELKVNRKTSYVRIGKEPK